MAEQKKTTVKRPKQSDHVQMMRADGKAANVHKSMIEDYRKGGYEMVQ